MLADELERAAAVAEALRGRPSALTFRVEPPRAAGFRWMVWLDVAGVARFGRVVETTGKPGLDELTGRCTDAGRELLERLEHWTPPARREHNDGTTDRPDSGS